LWLHAIFLSPIFLSIFQCRFFDRKMGDKKMFRSAMPMKSSQASADRKGEGDVLLIC